MPKLPAILLYPGDWKKDPVSTVSLAAQGLWLRIMFLMHESARYGYLCTRQGSPFPPINVATECGLSLGQYEALLAELDSVHVPSRTAAGVIFSRRMVRDEKKRAQTRKRVQKHRDVACNADVMPMSQGFSSSSSYSIKEESKEGAAQQTAPPSPPPKNLAWEQYQERERIAAERSAHKKGKPRGRTYTRPSVQPAAERPIHETPAERKSRVSRETVDRAIRNIRERREREQRPISGLHGCAGGDYRTGDRASVSGSSPPQEQRLPAIAG